MQSHELEIVGVLTSPLSCTAAFYLLGDLSHSILSYSLFSARRSIMIHLRPPVILCCFLVFLSVILVFIKQHLWFYCHLLSCIHALIEHHQWCKLLFSLYHPHLSSLTYYFQQICYYIRYNRRRFFFGEFQSINGNM